MRPQRWQPTRPPSLGFSRQEHWSGAPYLQRRNRDIDVENKCMDIEGKSKGWEELGGWDWHIYTVDKIDNCDSEGQGRLECCDPGVTKRVGDDAATGQQEMRTYYRAQGTLLNALWWPEWKEVQKGGVLWICMADSSCCTVEIAQHCKASIVQYKLIGKYFFVSSFPGNWSFISLFSFPLEFFPPITTYSYTSK